MAKSGRVFILPALFFVAFIVGAQERGDISSSIWFHSIDKHPDFSPSFNYFIHRDVENFIWISSTSGLNVYDGIRFNQYFANPEDSTALKSDNIQSIFFEDNDKNVWFSTDHSIQVYRRKSNDFKSYFDFIGPLKKEPNEYRIFFLERDTFLWFKADREIYRWNIYLPESTVTLVDTFSASTYLVDTTLNGTVNYIYATGKLSENKGEYLKVSENLKKTRLKWNDWESSDELPVTLNDIFTEGNSSWLGTDKGLYLWDRAKGQLKKIEKKTINNCYFTPFDEERLLLWGEERGFQIFNKSSGIFRKLDFRDFDNETILSKNVAQVYIDPEKLIWISFLNDGLVYADPYKNKFSPASIPLPYKGNEENTYTAFLNDGDSNFWYGTQTQGVFYSAKASEKTVEYKRKEDPSANSLLNWVTGIEQDGNNNTWVSTRSGMTLLNRSNKTLEPIPSIDDKMNQDFLDLIKLKNGDILGCTAKDGIYKIEKNNNGYRLRSVLNDSLFYSSLYEDRFGNIYVCRNTNEIAVYNVQSDTLSLKTVIPYEGIVTGYFESLKEEKLWISSFLGIAKVDIASHRLDTVFSKSKTFQNNSIHAMLGDDQGYLWLTTPKGLFSFQRDTFSLRKFYLSDGTQSEKFHMQAAIKLPNGILRFGGDKGLTDIDPANIGFSYHDPTIQITDIKFNDQIASDLICENTKARNVSQLKKLVRPYQDNTVSFEFVGIDYSDPNTVQLSYKLEGADEDWVVLKKGEPGFARYTNLKENTYKFRIRSTNADATKVSAGDEPILELVILPPFYRQPWFLAAVFTLLMLGGYWYYRYRINQIKEKAELKNKALENKMAALRAQMNPHFIFNSLQTLSGLIVRKDTKGSIEYVSQFAKLMRVILENSRLGFISLEKEIELLELYLNVESKRFRVPFQFDIKTGEKLNTIKILIPSMLLQPFVENSIKHGLFHKKEAGKIDIVFNENNGLLKCVIEDNGIGRRKSAELNNQQGRQHQSRGLEIVKDRLKTLQKAKDKEYTIQIIDLYDREKNAIGTRVEVLLPILMSER